MYIMRNYKLQQLILRDYNYKCALCKKDKILEFHHIIPAMLGGKFRKRNIIPLCKEYHNKTISYGTQKRVYHALV